MSNPNSSLSTFSTANIKNVNRPGRFLKRILDDLFGFNGLV
jgi:hypothetical protein